MGPGNYPVPIYIYIYNDSRKYLSWGPKSSPNGVATNVTHLPNKSMLFQVPRWHSFWVNPVEVVLTRWFRLFCPIFSFRLITQSQCLCTSDPAGRVVPSFSCALTPSLCPCMCIGHREIPMILPFFALLICYILNTGYWRGWLFVKWSSTGMWCHMAIASSRDSSCILRRRFSVPPYSYRLPLLVSSLFPFSSFSQSPGPGTACFRTFLFFFGECLKNRNWAGECYREMRSKKYERGKSHWSRI